MPGMNLSQSAQAAEAKLKPRTSFADKSVYVAFILLLLAGMSYGGVLWYLKDLEKKKIALVDQIEAEKKASYGGEDIQSVSRFYVKSKEILDKRTVPNVNPKSELAVLSAQVLPEVVLESYTNDLSKGTVQITGKAKEFRNVAEQMYLLKRSGNFSSVSTGALSLGEDGSIGFTFDMMRVSSGAGK